MNTDPFKISFYHILILTCRRAERLMLLLIKHRDFGAAAVAAFLTFKKALLIIVIIAHVFLLKLIFMSCFLVLTCSSSFYHELAKDFHWCTLEWGGGVSGLRDWGVE